MRFRTSVLLGVLLCAAPAGAQQKFLPAEIDAGRDLYLANCTGCHGPEGDGVGGINFSQGKFRRGQSDEDLIRLIVRGIPGTPMPPSGLAENRVATIVAYLRSMTAGNGDATAGDPAKGKAIFEGKGECITCHQVGLNGMHVGPSLTDIGLQRRAADLLRSLVEPNADVRPENRAVKVRMRDGTGATGRLLNQDTFSIQIIDLNDKLRSIDKAAVRDVQLDANSPMPSFKDKLSAQELADVVSYLASLKGRP